MTLDQPKPLHTAPIAVMLRADLRLPPHRRVSRTSSHVSWILCAVAGSALLSGCASNSSSTAASSQTPTENDGRTPAVTIEPTANESVLARAERLKQEGMTKQALAEFERAIEVNPRLTRAYLGAADLYKDQGDYQAAAARYGKAAELEPSNFDAQYGHGLMLQLLNRMNDSVRAYLRALRIKPDDFDANLQIAVAYLALDDSRSGLPYAQRAVELKPGSQPAHVNLGAIYRALGRHEDAVNSFQQAAELATLSEPLLLNWADSLGRAGRFEEMINLLDQLVKTTPSSDAYERLGSGFFRAGRFAESQQAFRTALELDPNNASAHSGVGVCLLNEYLWSKEAGTTNEQLRESALRHLRTSVQIDPRQPAVIDLINRFR